MNRVGKVGLLAILIVCGASVSNSAVTMCLVGTVGTNIASAACTNFCGRTEIAGGAVVGSCVADLAACEVLCAGTANCISACCNDANDCNSAVETMRGTVNCGVGTHDGTNFPTAEMTCDAGDLCGRKETTSGGTTTVVGSCSTVAECETLCDGATNCVSACCNDADTCNTRTVAQMDSVVRCGSGVLASGNFPVPLTCTAEKFCGRTEVTGGDTTGTCSTQAECDSLCSGTANCVSACCSNADDCNTRTVAQINAALRCGTGVENGGAFPTATTCAAGEFCARKEISGGDTVGSCETQASCELLCSGVASCTSACCNDGDFCSSLAVTDIVDVVRCATGSVTDGTLTGTMVCASTEKCRRTETTSGNTVTTAGECLAGATSCDDSCASPNCVAACCTNDLCNTLTVAVQTGIVCMVGTTTTVGSNAATGSMVATHCSPNLYCAKTETTTTANNVDTVVRVGSCQADVTACDLLCTGVTGCVAACCNDADNCNSESVTTIKNVVTCGVGTLASNVFPTPAMACQATEQCGRTETTSGGTTAVVGSCSTAASCTDGLCGSTSDCVAACCNVADGCNSLTVETQMARQCLTGTTTQVGSADATGSLTLQHCASGQMCGRKETTTTSGDTSTVVIVGSCSTAAQCNDGTMLCNGVAGCIEYCCDTDSCNSAAVTTTTTTTTTASTTTTATTTSGAEHAAQINMLVMMGLVVLGCFMA